MRRQGGTSNRVRNHKHETSVFPPHDELQMFFTRYSTWQFQVIPHSSPAPLRNSSDLVLTLVESTMKPLSSWRCFLLLAFITSSLADWNLDSSSGGGGLDDEVFQLFLDGNPIAPNAVTDEFSTSTTDGVPNLAQVPQDGNVEGISKVGKDPSTLEVASGCYPPSPGMKRRRVRRGDSAMCSAGDTFKNTPSQFTQPGTQNIPPSVDPGTKRPPSANASPRRFIPKLDPETEQLSRVFLPKGNRPRQDDYFCRKQGYYIAVCAHQDFEILGQNSGGYVNFLDPCTPRTHFFISPPSPKYPSTTTTKISYYVSMDG